MYSRLAQNVRNSFIFMLKCVIPYYLLNQWIPNVSGSSFLRRKRPGREAGHSWSSSIEVTMHTASLSAHFQGFLMLNHYCAFALLICT